MYSYRSLILLPNSNEYSSIHECSITKTLTNLSECSIQRYSSASELINILNVISQDNTIRIILIYGASELWPVLTTSLSQYHNYSLKPASSPYDFYARINEMMHILGITAQKNNLALAEKQLFTYYRAHSPLHLLSLSQQVAHKLKQANLSISCAESCTGGLIAKTLTDVAGASAYFCGGVCTYTAEIKQHVLHVPNKTITEKGVVSKETAEAMAIGAKELFGTDIALSTTGVAGPGSDADGNPEGLVYCCINIHGDIYIYRYLASNETICTDRAFIRSSCVIFLFENLLKQLQQY